MELRAKISERGNGLPDVDSYVPGSDGELYRVVKYIGPIHTGAPGEGNYKYAIVETAEWEDCEEGDEFPAQVIVTEEQD